MRIIVAFPKLEDAKNLRNVLIRNGFDDTMAYNNAAQTIGAANDSDGGVVVCGYKLPDMHYSELYAIHSREFVSTVQMMTMDIARELKRRKKTQPKRRTAEEEKIINKAKALLMERNQMTENDAHKYIQKLSMDSGNNLVETAEMILTFE